MSRYADRLDRAVRAAGQRAGRALVALEGFRTSADLAQRAVHRDLAGLVAVLAALRVEIVRSLGDDDGGGPRDGRRRQRGRPAASTPTRPSGFDHLDPSVEAAAQHASRVLVALQDARHSPDPRLRSAYREVHDLLGDLGALKWTLSHRLHLPPPTVVIPTTEQVESVRAGMPGRLSALVTLVAGTGLRPSEVGGLTIDRLDLDRREVLVDRQLVSVAEGRPVLGPLDPDARARTIPLPQAVVDAVSSHLVTYPPGRNGLVFTLDDGRPLTPQELDRRWRPLAEAAGLPRRSGPHALRHYYASLLIRFGESAATVQARLGHATTGETLATYAHLWPDPDERTRQAVDSVLGTPRRRRRTDAD